MTAPIPSPLARAHAELRAVLADDEPYRQQVPLVAGAGRVGAARGWAGELTPLGVGEEALEHRVALPATGQAAARGSGSAQRTFCGPSAAEQSKQRAFP